jgi:hypothetical protein
MIMKKNVIQMSNKELLEGIEKFKDADPHYVGLIRREIERRKEYQENFLNRPKNNDSILIK